MAIRLVRYKNVISECYHIFYILKSFCYTRLIPLSLLYQFNYLVVPLVTLEINTNPIEQVKQPMSIHSGEVASFKKRENNLSDQISEVIEWLNFQK